MRAALIDDDPQCIALLENYLARYGKETGTVFDVQRYPDGLSFLDAKNTADLIFLDIDMPGINGIAAAKRLRQKDEEAVLIFVTAMAQYAIHGYEVDALDFLVKPVSYGNFLFSLKRALKAVSLKENCSFMIPAKDGMIRCNVRDIRYVEVQGHDLTYHLIDKNITVRGKISDAEEQLKKHSFLRSSNSFLINPAFIDRIKGYDIYMNADIISISHPRKKKFMEELGAWYARGG